MPYDEDDPDDEPDPNAGDSDGDDDVDEEDEEDDEDEEQEERWEVTVDFAGLKFLHWRSFSTDARLDRRVTGLIRSASSCGPWAPGILPGLSCIGGNGYANRDYRTTPYRQGVWLHPR